MHFHVVVVRAVTEKKCTKKTDRWMDGWMEKGVANRYMVDINRN